MSETIEQTCARNPQWAADEIRRLREEAHTARAVSDGSIAFHVRNHLSTVREPGPRQIGAPGSSMREAWELGSQLADLLAQLAAEKRAREEAEAQLAEVQRLGDGLAGSLPPPGTMAEVHGVSLLPPWDGALVAWQSARAKRTTGGG